MCDALAVDPETAGWVAEKGYAAHWKYKEGANDESRFDKWFQQIREVLNTEDNDSVDFLQDFKTSFLSENMKETQTIGLTSNRCKIPLTFLS